MIVWGTTLECKYVMNLILYFNSSVSGITAACSFNSSLSL
ncbi:38495_t:CDS:2 [Gigaspora margarita]|uniref:38495_t:CDS:1 n=1 Tax=Gigaspora margarita TaxID=4874 RepID=A0ABN7UEB5_GIGMA|nr:38495_t:CDS:2 [Gigaspora margarita]